MYSEKTSLKIRFRDEQQVIFTDWHIFFKYYIGIFNQCIMLCCDVFLYQTRASANKFLLLRYKIHNKNSKSFKVYVKILDK